MKKNYILLSIIVVLLIFIIGLGVSKRVARSNMKENEESLSAEVPLKVNEISLEFKIIKGGENNKLEVQYKNNTKEEISNLVLETRLKDTGEIVTLQCNNIVSPDKMSEIFLGIGPKSGNIEDIDILKYKISLSKGVYMEYDVESNQYNWS